MSELDRIDKNDGVKVKTTLFLSPLWLALSMKGHFTASTKFKESKSEISERKEKN